MYLLIGTVYAVLLCVYSIVTIIVLPYMLVVWIKNPHDQTLNNFANQKLLGNAAKHIAVLEAIDYFIDIDP